MKAAAATRHINEIIDNLREARQVIEDNDTLDFDIETNLNKLEELSDEVSEYVEDLT